MTGVQVVDGGIGSGAVLETAVTDADLRRAHDAAAEPPPADGEPAISPEVKAAYDTAKSAAEAQYAPNRRRAEARRQREGEPAAVPAAAGQTAISDFGGGGE